MGTLSACFVYSVARALLSQQLRPLHVGTRLTLVSRGGAGRSLELQSTPAPWFRQLLNLQALLWRVTDNL